MVVITRRDLTNGYQSQQSTHSALAFAYKFPNIIKNWEEVSGSIICLQVNNEDELKKLSDKLKKYTDVVDFYEPDLNDELTSICLYADESVRKKVRYLPLLGKPKRNISDILYDMSITPQTDNQSVLEHGLSVLKYYKQLCEGNTEGWRLPKWWDDHKDYIFENMHSKADVEEYMMFHDIGKPYCIEYDENGRRHYPNHAEVSAKVYSEYKKNPVVEELIRMDMLFHKVEPEVFNSIKERLSSDDDNFKKTINTLIVSALCELHSNAEMFGGIESDSFKIKFKNYEKKAKQLLSLYVEPAF